MAKASKHHIGPGTQGKGDGSGALTELPEGVLEENMVLSNRDKKQHSGERGLDSKVVHTEQYHAHAANRRNFDETLGAPTEGNTSGLSPTKSTESGENSSLATQGKGNNRG